MNFTSNSKVSLSQTILKIIASQIILSSNAPWNMNNMENTVVSSVYLDLFWDFYKTKSTDYISKCLRQVQISADQSVLPSF